MKTLCLILPTVAAALAGLSTSHARQEAGGGAPRCGRLPTGWMTPTQCAAERPGIGGPGAANYLLVDRDDDIIWNDTRVSEETLAAFIDRIAAMNPLPRLYFRAEDGASCIQIRAVRTALSPLCAPCIETSEEEWRAPRRSGL